MLDLLALPFLACLIFTGIHAYLGLHLLARGVIFVDLALAQVAALGLTLALLAGHPIQSDAAWWYALVFAVGGALLFAFTRVRRGPLPQEAIIGIVYAISAALGVLVVDRAPQGAEHIKQLLVGSILTVNASEVTSLAALMLTAELTLMVGSAAAFDNSKYPDWSGQWLRPSDVGTQWDQTRPSGLAQQAPLTPEYQIRLEASSADQAVSG